MRLVVLFSLIFMVQISLCQGLKSIKGGLWKGELAMNDRLFIPFSINFSFPKNKIQMEIINSDERLKMRLKSENDSITAFFPESEAYLKFKLAQNNSEMRGYWVNPNKKFLLMHGKLMKSSRWHQIPPIFLGDGKQHSVPIRKSRRTPLESLNKQLAQSKGLF
jgi:hypothetical protein